MSPMPVNTSSPKKSVTLKEIFESATRLFTMLANWNVKKIKTKTAKMPAANKELPFKIEGTFCTGPMLYHENKMSQVSRTELIKRSPSDALKELAAYTVGLNNWNCRKENICGNWYRNNR